MEFFILDTNIFFNMEAGLSLGEKTEDVVIRLTNIGRELNENGKGKFFMTPGAVSEFLSFFDNKNKPFISDFLSVLTIESPDVSTIMLSGSIFYKLIEDIRTRSYRGLNIAEEEISAAALEFSDKKINERKDFQIKIGKYIKKFRDRYRNATRTGFLDSVVDLDLIMLAKQKRGFLVSTDEGVLSWGRTFGVKEMPSPAFAKRLESLLHSRRE